MMFNASIWIKLIQFRSTGQRPGIHVTTVAPLAPRLASSPPPYLYSLHMSQEKPHDAKQCRAGVNPDHPEKGPHPNEAS